MMTTGTALKLWALDAPTMDLDAGDLVVGASGKVTFPLPAFLIQHDRALILFDTSFSPVLNENPYDYFGDFAAVANVQTNPGQRIDRQIASLGFRIEDVTHVVLSHTHSDHSGGLYLFPQAKFYAGPGEFDWARAPSAETAHLFRYSDDLEPVRFFDWTTLEGSSQDLLGDGSITILHTPGHTPGELALVVKLPSQTIVLTGDTVHLRVGYDMMSPDPHDWDKTAAVASIGILKKLEAEGARIWIGHDPGDWAAFGGPLVGLE
ncbi:hypothetical protein GCM10022381_28220 [Leifsonia kafniensis]|uniref:Metallo-beta-lactamase domain-containing protein n=1 Tax=Leifsonia kafniensis TaxID=475957 RepID=A0ABP7KQI0_9MICO